MKKILITGSTDGIGKATAKFYAKNGNKVIIHGRNKERISQIQHEFKGYNIDYIIADFARMSEVKECSLKLKAKYKNIDILINNAAIIAEEYIKTADGLESTFQINHLSPFLFTLNILSLLKEKKGSQIINISSNAHSDSLEFSTILEEKNFDSYKAYEISKLANILFTYKLSEILKGDRVFVNTLHPGVIETKLLHVLWSGGDSVNRAVGMIKMVEEYVEANEVSGQYFIEKAIGKTSLISYDKKIQDQMWQFCMALIQESKIE